LTDDPHFAQNAIPACFSGLIQRDSRTGISPFARALWPMDSNLPERYSTGDFQSTQKTSTKFNKKMAPAPAGTATP
jgi:hypothetical protein